ncbi:MAG: mandelate racemase/muconate lactonizing enzyme family protein [Rhodospirillales bacterium]|jgi:L-alanine-DL-glutamate epimerase-like enolase superfamily enzyme|nr:mandelate racemase/muconate lactonizing enzyme family protein [Rhodospirillales bacterium]
MKIVAVETSLTRIPFDMGAKPVSFGGVGWQAMHTLWVRVVTDTGIEGWGEGFGHACVAATRSVLDTQVAPAVLGQDARDIAGMRARLSRTLHLFGRNGPHIYALSALDIALWDIAGKEAGQPLWRLWGATPPNATGPDAANPGRLRAYASLLRYGSPDLVAAAAERAAGRGYADIKLHEIEVPMVAAARAALGPTARLMVDTNCPWTIGQATAMARALAACDLTWLEEPVWPPEDYAGLAQVRAAGGVPIAAGENAAGLMDFRAAFAAGALDVAQPSVIKIGGPSAMLEIAALARAAGVRLVPHNAYFGAGYLASLHLNATLAPDAPFERLFIDLEASPYHDTVTAPDGHVTVPNGPGLGRDPDPEVLARYRVGEPTLHRA